jgi:hypothetical protein
MAHNINNINRYNNNIYDNYYNYYINHNIMPNNYRNYYSYNNNYNNDINNNYNNYNNYNYNNNNNYNNYNNYNNNNYNNNYNNNNYNNNDMQNLALRDYINQLIIEINLIERNQNETPIETFTRVGIQVNVEEVHVEEVEAKEICSVCLDNENCVDCKTSCSHNFHARCLSQWVKKNNSCPMCRGTITSINTNL